MNYLCSGLTFLQNGILRLFFGREGVHQVAVQIANNKYCKIINNIGGIFTYKILCLICAVTGKSQEDF